MLVRDKEISQGSPKFTAKGKGEQMKAAIVEKPGQFAVKDIDKPTITDDQVLLKVVVSSICNATDGHIYDGSFEGFHDYYPQIMGHEVCGDVVEVGKNVTDVQLGDRLVLYTQHGAFCEYTKVQINNRPDWEVYAKVPKDFPVEAIPLSEMFHGAYIGCAYPAQIKSGEHVLLVGQGPLGLTTLGAIKAETPGAVVHAIEIYPNRLKMSSKMGADFVYDRSKMSAEEIADKVRKNTGGKGADACIMCISDDLSRENNAFNMAIQCLARGGRMTGMNVETKTSHKQHIGSMREIFRKEITVHHTLNPVYHDNLDMTRAFQRMVDAVVDGRIPLGKMITHRFNLDEIPEALELTTKKLDQCIKVIVYPKVS
jgi:threonine dehydrogenase-like Zn-dependent dehydrogenase